VDALIFYDTLASDVYDQFKNGKTDEEIKEFIIKELETNK
jgi:hypothetical protein